MSSNLTPSVMGFTSKPSLRFRTPSFKLFCSAALLLITVLVVLGGISGRRSWYDFTFVLGPTGVAMGLVFLVFCAFSKTVEIDSNKFCTGIYFFGLPLKKIEDSLNGFKVLIRKKPARSSILYYSNFYLTRGTKKYFITAVDSRIGSAKKLEEKIKSLTRLEVMTEDS